MLNNNNNNNNIAFQSQASWGRLELKPAKSPKSRKKMLKFNKINFKILLSVIGNRLVAYLHMQYEKSLQEINIK